MENSNVQKVVSGCITWINDNEFHGYNGSIRSLVRWYVINDRRFQWISQAEVDEATKCLQRIFPDGKIPLQKIDTSINTLHCIACDGSAVDGDNLCNACLSASIESCFERR